MISIPGMLPPNGRAVVQKNASLLSLTDAIRLEAAEVLRAVLEQASWKRVQSADVPGAKAEYLSRAKNGCDCNPLYRIAALFLLMKRLGMGREGALRLLGWLAEIIDRIWPPEETANLEDALSKDSEQDCRDDHLRYLTAKGCPTARRQLLVVKREQAAHVHTVILALQQAEAR